MANRLIAKNGMEMSFLKISQGKGIDPVAGKRPVSIEESKFMGVIVKPTKAELDMGRFQDVSQVVLIPGDAVPRPAISDRLKSQGREWEIKEVYEVMPAGESILFKIGVKDAGLCRT